MESVVSLLTPVFNGGQHIHRLLESVLSQTYKSIEMIIIDDGSTDETKEIIDSYRQKFENKGYSLVYIFQENAGQAAAINKGLLTFTGDYIAWPDSDDYYSLDKSIEIMVNCLKESDDSVSMLRTNALVVSEKDFSKIKEIIYENSEGSYFTDCIFERNFNLVPGKFMVKSNILRRELMNNQIYPSRFGQNWQLLIPILYRYTCITVDQFLYTVVARSDSHSRKDFHSVYNQIDKCGNHQDILIETVNRLKSIDKRSKEALIRRIEIKYIKRRMFIYFSIKNKKQFIDEYERMKNIANEELRLKDHLKHLLLILFY